MTETKQKVRYPVVILQRTIKIIISDQIMNEIKYLTTRIASVEWSGILFYSTMNDIDSDDFVITLESIYPMDKGSGGATDYAFTEEFVGYRMDNPATLKMNFGHIHSHNTMPAYFSSVDMDEMNLNSENHNYYVSIVVNNALDIVGRIGFVGESTNNSKYAFKGTNGSKQTITLSNIEKKIFIYNCVFEYETNNIDETFQSLVDGIISKNAKKLALQKEAMKNKPNIIANVHKYNKPNVFTKPLPELGLGMPKIFDDTNDEILIWEDTFPNYWLHHGDIDAESYGPEDSVVILLDNLKGSDIELTQYTKQLIDGSHGLWKNYFLPTDNVSFIDAMTTVYDYFELSTELHPELEVILAYLRILIENLKK